MKINSNRTGIVNSIMYHSPKWFRSIKNLPSSSLIEQQDELLQGYEKAASQTELYALGALNSVTPWQASLRDAQPWFRTWFLVPWFLGVLFTLWVNIDDFRTDWRNKETSLASMVISYKKAYGDNYFETEVQSIKDRIALLDENLELSFKNYLYYRHNYYMYGQSYFITDIVLTIFYLLVLPFLFYYAFLWPRRANLWLEPGSGLMYTWHKGRVYAARYSQVGVVELPQGVSFILHGLDKNGQRIKRAFSPAASPVIVLSSAKQRKEILAFVVNYMVKGFDAVSTQEFHRSPPLFLRKQKKPADFDQQLKAILANFDSEQ